MSEIDHQTQSREMTARCAVITASDSRTEATDRSGRLMRDMLEAAGHGLVHYAIVPDDIERIRAELSAAVEHANVVLFNGGTGISKRDGTVEAVTPLLEKTMPGYGELFRMLSFDEIGPAAMLSRAVAGVYRNSLVFCTPGSTAAVRLAMERLILPDLKHLIWEILRQA